MRDPVSDIVQQGHELHRNAIGLDADVALRSPECTGPSPDIPEHPLVQGAHEIDTEYAVERKLPASARPGGARDDVFPLGLVEVPPVRDPAL